MARRKNNETLRQDWVKSTQGLGVDELYLAKKYAQARADHHRKPQAIYKDSAQEMWYVDAASKTALDPYHARFVLRVEPKEANVAKRSSRTPNTHDPDKSLKSFESALAAADRELVSANESMEKGNGPTSLNRIIRATYWLGQARAEMKYTGVSAAQRKRVKELEEHSRKWGNDFTKWQKEQKG